MTFRYYVTAVDSSNWEFASFVAERPHPVETLDDIGSLALEAVEGDPDRVPDITILDWKRLQ